MLPARIAALRARAPRGALPRRRGRLGPLLAAGKRAPPRPIPRPARRASRTDARRARSPSRCATSSISCSPPATASPAERLSTRGARHRGDARPRWARRSSATSRARPASCRARPRMRSGSWWRAAWSPATASRVCARCSHARRSRGRSAACGRCAAGGRRVARCRPAAGRCCADGRRALPTWA